MYTIFLTLHTTLLQQLRASGVEAHLIGDDMPPLRDASIVVVGRNGDAKQSALELVSRGVGDFQISYAEVEDGKNMAAALKQPKHLHWDDARSLNEAPDDPDFETYASGFKFFDPYLRYRFPELGVIAGPYGSGKSTLAQILAMRFIATHGEALNCRALLCSWEDMASEVRLGAQKHALALDLDPVSFLDRIHFVSRPPSEDRLIAWYIELVRYYRRRFNTWYYVLDPWNEIDHIRDRNQNETEYVREMMKAFRRLVDELEIKLDIVTHIAAKHIRGDGSLEPFRIAHAFGSSQFANKMDRGICVLRTKKYGDHMVVHQDKAKVERLMGRKGTVALRLNQETHALTYDTEVTKFVKDVWKD